MFTELLLIVLLEEVAEIERHSLELLLPNHVRCASHTLNLIGITDFNNILKSNLLGYEKHKNILKKCSGLWNKINRPKSSERIISVLGSQLIYPVVTRWNSLHDSVKNILFHQANINKLCHDLEVETFLDCDFEYLKEYVVLLQPIAEAIDFLQSESGMFYGFLLPTLATIKTKYTRLMMTSNSDCIVEKANRLLLALDNSFDTYVNLKKGSESAVVASILCPSVKLKWIKAINPAFDSYKEVEAIDMVKTALTNFFKDTVSTDLSKPDDSEASKYFDFDIAETQEEHSPTGSPQWQSDLYAYIADDSKGLQMLNNYCLLKKAFLKFNCPSPSSAAVERLFSHASFLNTPRRGCLTDENFEKLLLLKVNNIV